ncbi:hypothetical protein V8C26DRAFT_389460 [Trichoderma gracile]
MLALFSLASWIRCCLSCLKIFFYYFLPSKASDCTGRLARNRTNLASLPSFAQPHIHELSWMGSVDGEPRGKGDLVGPEVIDLSLHMLLLLGQTRTGDGGGGGCVPVGGG